MEEVTRNDFIFFKNEVLKDMKSIENKMNDKISSSSSGIKNSISKLEEKLENLKKRLDEIIKNPDSNNKIEQINNRIDKFKSKFEERILVNSTKISSLEREINNVSFKYDRIFLNNISSPGLIGDGCPYPTMKSFLVYVNNKIKEMNSSKEKFFNDFKSYENWVKLALDKFREENIGYKNETNEFLMKELNEYDKRSFEKMNIVEEKLNSIKIENGNYNHNLNKKWEELEEKLNLFNNINDNIINTYNNVRKEYIQIKNKFNDLSKYFKTMKLTANGNNRALFDEMSKKASISKKQILNIENSKYSNILPAISSLEDVPKLLINRNSENSIQKFNIEIKENKLIKKDSFKIENIDLSNMNVENNVIRNNLKQNFNRNKILKSSDNIKIFSEINKISNNDKLIEGKSGNKNNLNIYKNIYLTQPNKDQGTEILNSNISSDKKKDLIEEQRKESSIINSNDDENEKNISKEINNINNDNDLHSNSMSNLDTIEQKITSMQKTNENENNNNNILAKINLDEELNKINQKFDNLYEKLNNKIISIITQINLLINKINKNFYYKDNIKKIKEINFSCDRRKRNIFLDNSDMGLCLPFNSTYDNFYNRDKKSFSGNENSVNETNKKKYRELYNNKLHYNIININRKKLADFRANSNDFFNLVKKKKFNNNNIKNDYIRMIDKESINKLESYLIKKFSEPN